MKFYTTNNKTNYTYCLKSCIARQRWKTINTHICVCWAEHLHCKK